MKKCIPEELSRKFVLLPETKRESKEVFPAIENVARTSTPSIPL